MGPRGQTDQGGGGPWGERGGVACALHRAAGTSAVCGGPTRAAYHRLTTTLRRPRPSVGAGGIMASKTSLLTCRLAMAALCGCPLAAGAQQVPATLVGVVRDTAGIPIP